MIVFGYETFFYFSGMNRTMQWNNLHKSLIFMAYILQTRVNNYYGLIAD